MIKFLFKKLINFSIRYYIININFFKVKKIYLLKYKLFLIKKHFYFSNLLISQK